MDAATGLMRRADCLHARSGAYSSRFQLDHWLLLSLGRATGVEPQGRRGRGMPMHSRKHSRKRIAQPFEVRVDGWHRGAFEEAHDAIKSAKIAQREHPSALIAVANRLTGTLVAQLAH
jgi:hypothetical protein